MDSNVTSLVPFTATVLLTTSSPLSTSRSASSILETSTGLNDITPTASPAPSSVVTSVGNDTSSATSSTIRSVTGSGSQASGSPATTSTAMFSSSYGADYSIATTTQKTQSTVEDGFTNSNIPTTTFTLPLTSRANITSSSPSWSTTSNQSGQNSSTASPVGTASSETPVPDGSSTVTRQTVLSSNSVEPDNQTSPTNSSESTTLPSPSVTVLASPPASNIPLTSRADITSSSPSWSTTSNQSGQNSNTASPISKPDYQTSPTNSSESTPSDHVSPPMSNSGTSPGNEPSPTTSMSLSLPGSSKAPEISTSSAMPTLTSEHQTLIISLSIVGFVLIAILVLVAVVCYKKKRFGRHQVSESGFDNVTYGIARTDINHYDEINLDPDGDSVSGSNSHYAEIYAPKSLPDGDHEVEFVESDLYSGSTTKLSTFASDRPS